MFKRIQLMNPLKLGVLAAGLLVPGAAFAATSAIATTDLNMRMGPSTGYQVVDVIPDGGRVTVHGCVRGYNWCDVSWRGLRGWASGNYLAYLGKRYYRDPIPRIGVTIGVPIIGYRHDDYFNRWYRHRRHEIRHERREHRRDVRHERHEDRRAVRHERRDVKHERQDLRHARHDLRKARRHGENLTQERHRVHREKRQLRHEKRQLHKARRDRRHDRRDD
ncbi:MAG: SH3 domain-containing protein [Rhizobiaceae bacterium]|jgi:uncharacterized protein YraI